MIYLFFQTWIWMLVAAALGLAAGWLIWGRGSASVDESTTDHVDDIVDVFDKEADQNPESDTSSKSIDSQKDELTTTEERIEEPGTNNGKSDGKPEVGHEGDVEEELLTEGATIEIPRDKNAVNSGKLMFVTSSDAAPDNLKRISGIGRVLEKVLNDLGICHLRQIADFSREDVDWVDNHLSFSGRIDREDWVGQAKTLVGDGQFHSDDNEN